MHLPANLEKRRKPLAVLLSIALIAAIGVLDLLTGYEIAFSLFYVMPIALLTWSAGRWAGVAASVAGALVWLWADSVSGNPYSSGFIPLWNTTIRLAFFLIITILLTALRSAIERERETARTDSLTGALNSRSFHDAAEKEIDRCRRYSHAFTLAYIDLDNFKAVNDNLGHTTGDEALRTVATFIRQHTRTTDVVARLGGDEFGLLLPETNEESARAVMAKIQQGLAAKMQENHWPITFSIGVLTCTTAPPSGDALIRMADELMYSVKHAGKNAAKFATCDR